jgi:hypothetical protein
MLPSELYQGFCVEKTLGTGDASKELIAAEAGVTICVVAATLISLVAAAQAIYVGDTSGNVKALSVAASMTANLAVMTGPHPYGLQLTKGEALIIKPAAAGPSVHVSISGYKIRS